MYRLIKNRVIIDDKLKSFIKSGYAANSDKAEREVIKTFDDLEQALDELREYYTIVTHYPQEKIYEIEEFSVVVGNKIVELSELK